ncbi:MULTISPECIES: CNNM family magnesium/cobalt transport protein CorC [unclassified Avibacterium]|uniref:CNNM family magnesium/cobalt transport protein CorC n=1 Tax=unclassified Avibacterium TaxID=2685287 RepID=UPI00202721AB|nr:MULTISPECIES: CNNM family magnesium/cobalt transport protein CorC [unclassified Avibacterium]URL02529.1 CNNM family magnesium/cobalt transport protein CorC [Avibacterium sp. 20-126]MCW9698573.1 CNNM family magnesium/cobalt transport protein CorC [Avibacterium sp. 20-129]MCW9732384.1 CNNM family magnesium/cobalt transport protein CorC [Avibacterium sp. 20-15]URL04550.1 CNNM family magnesium/cobalt transport protein CorC [Avibacterium sp. 20-132]URL07194.1 CNNM family magnesium/cobalt transpo
MTDDSQNTGLETTNKKNFLQSLFGRFFQGELKNREELVEVIRDSEQNELIDQDTREMIEGVMEIAELRVRDIMIPRSQIVFIEADQDLDACLETIIESAHSRFPVITDEKDNIAGILHAKDLLKFLRSNAEEFDLLSLLRPVVIVPESKRVDRMLKDFRSERFHMAIVVDEFGAVSGLVTIEDILEQIVGDIEDEFDEEDVADIRQLSRHTYAVRALTDIEDFNQQFHTHFTDEEVDTVGGVVMQAFGHLPKRGEEITLENLHFKVTSADSRRIIQLRVTVPDECLEEIATHEENYNSAQ